MILATSKVDFCTGCEVRINVLFVAPAVETVTVNAETEF
jgi:hypothetical protein